MTPLALLLGLAYGAPPLELRASGAIDDGAHPWQTGWSLGAGVRHPLSDVASLSGAVEVGLSVTPPPLPRVYLPLELNLHPANAASSSLYLALGAAPTWTDKLRLQGLAGLGFHRRESAWRGEWHLLISKADPVAWSFTLGYAPQRSSDILPSEPPVEPIVVATPEPPPPEVEAPPQAPRVTPPTLTEPADALVWIPHPTCTWVPLSEAGPLIAALPPGTIVNMQADGYLPTSIALTEEPLTLALTPTPLQGGMTVLAFPGDAVFVDGHPIQVQASASSSLMAPEGEHLLRVVGGGRVVEIPMAVADGFALWVRIPPPPPATVRFRVGSSTLGSREHAQLRRLAENSGETRFVVSGSFSPEGDLEANLALADARAEAVIAALVAAGVPQEQLIHEPPREPDASLTAEEQRRVQIRPVLEVSP